MKINVIKLSRLSLLEYGIYSASRRIEPNGSGINSALQILNLMTLVVRVNGIKLSVTSITTVLYACISGILLALWALVFCVERSVQVVSSLAIARKG